MDLSVAVVSWNTAELLRRCLESVASSITGLQYEVIVVDNGSYDGSADLVEREFSQATLIRNVDNRGFAAANNQAILIGRGRHVLLLNSDAVLLSGAAETMVRFLDAHPGVGAVGGQLLNADGSFQGSFADFPSLIGEIMLLTRLSNLVYPRSYPSYPTEQSSTARVVDWVFGACLMVRRRAIDQVGLLDEGYFMYSEETDWCFRLRKGGWSTYYLPEVKVPHWSGQSALKAPEQKRRQLYRSKLRFLGKHRGRLSAALFRVALGAASVGKLLVWLLASTHGEPAKRAYARQNARAYLVLLNQIW